MSHEINLQSSINNIQLLRIWETGQRQHPVDQALTILAAIYTDVPWETLASLSIGQRDDRLLAIYEQTFDSMLVGEAGCPQCEESLEFKMPIADMRPADKEERIGQLYLFEHDGYSLKFRLPNSFDLAMLVQQAAGSSNPAQILLERCILEPSNQEEAIEVAILPESVITEVSNRMSELDPQADITLNIECPDCEHLMTVVLDIIPFLWGRISAQARRILRDVHTLARAYGWRETEILTMSTARRQIYLDMCGGS